MKKSVAIIGGGPSALALASFLDSSKFEVSIYEQNKALGRKFLVAGDGGFNLTHSEELKQLSSRYTPTPFLTESLETFTNLDLRNWLEEIEVPTFIGSSKRVYPKEGIKPIDVLRAIKKVIEKNEVTTHLQEKWIGWNDDQLVFDSQKQVSADYTVFALGGGSWKVTGSNDKWLPFFNEKNIRTSPFQPSNCAYGVKWDNGFLNRHEGKPLKNISISCNGLQKKGEVVVTSFGLEGNAIYALSPELRKSLNIENAQVEFDLKPMLSESEIKQKLKKSSYKKITDKLKRDLKLNPIQIDLIKFYSSKESFLDENQLPLLIKQLAIPITGIAPLNEAISTVGGISLEEVDHNFELKKLPYHFCLGEMLDWDAPTGGYLLQACFSMGVRLAHYLNQV